MQPLPLAFLVAISMGYGTIAHGQDSLVGTYNGSYTFRTGSGDQQWGVQLNVASVENGMVKGTAILLTGGCAGSYPMQGKYDGTRLVMRATAKGGRGGDCEFGFNVTREGNKLVGKTGVGYPIQLSK